MLDGVFARGKRGVVHFHRTPRLTRREVTAVLATVERRLRRLLDRRGLGDDDAGSGASDGWAAEAPVLAGLAAASVQGLVATGPRAGARIRRCGDPPEAVYPPLLGPYHARLHGFDLHAGLVVPAGQRDRLERVCRYTLRPPVAQNRLHLTAGGEVWLALRHRWSDGTTHLRFDPLELLERLAALTPRPRINLILYHGVLAPRAAWRAEVVGETDGHLDPDEAIRTEAEALPAEPHEPSSEPATRSSRPGARLWAELMRRSFAHDINCSPPRGSDGARPDHASVPSSVRAGDRLRRSSAPLG